MVVVFAIVFYIYMADFLSFSLKIYSLLILNTKSPSISPKK